MENAYGIGVTNRYHLFLDDDADPLELLQLQERERELKKRSKTAEKENKVKVEPKPKVQAPAPRKTVKEPENNKAQDIKPQREEKSKPEENRAERPQRTGRFSGENREDRNNRRNREDFNGPPADKEWKPRRDFSDNEGGERRSFGGRGRGRGNFGGGRGNYERGGGRFNDRGKREHDSQQTESWDKRDHGEANKWSKSEEIDVKKLPEQTESESWDTEAPVTETAATTEPTDAKTDEPATGEETAEATTPAVDEPKELTLDEWKAQRAAQRQKPNYNLRKAGEGEDPSQWKKMYALDKKREGTESEQEEDLEFDISDYPQRVGRQKHVLDIQFTFNDVRRGGGPGRGWGRGRGGRGRGFGARGDRQGPRAPFKSDDAPPADVEEGPVHEVHTSRGRQNAPKVDDEHDFPSLG